MEKIKAFTKKYRHAWVFLYAFIYMPWFMWLEQRHVTTLHIIHSSLDHYIPFVEFFIVPYLLWFAYIPTVLLYMFFKAKKAEFYRFIIFLFSGMTLFLIISTVFPNGLMLRPDTFARDNIFTQIVQYLYKTDTSTNVFPSIHVFNSIGAYIAITHNATLKKNKWIHYGSLVLTISIVAATMFLKQHSVVDVSAGILLSYVLYQFIYVPETSREFSLSKQPASS